MNDNQLVPHNQQEIPPEIIVTDEGAFDKENQRSLYNLLPPAIQESLIMVKNSFLADVSWHTKKNEIDHMTDYQVVRKLRQAFWIEYSNAQLNKRKMQMTRIWQGITAASGDFYSIMKKEHFAAFIFTRPISKETKERALLEMAYEQIENIIGTSHIDKDGFLNASAAKVKVEIWKHLEERVHGGIMKKVHVQSEQKSINMNLEAKATPEQTQQLIDITQMRKAEELTQKLAELREQTKDIEAISHVIEEDDD